MTFSGEESSSNQPKSGLQALYSFCPFSLRETDPFQVILPPISYLNTDSEVEVGGKRFYRSRATREKFEVSASGNFTKTVVQPNKIYQWTFSEDDDEKVIYERRNIASPSNWDYPPNYIEFSHQSLTNTKYCEKGWVVASSEDECPIQRWCPDQEKPDSPGGCKHYDPHGRRFARLYNVYPGVEKHFSDPHATDFDQITSVRYGTSPFFSVGFTASAQFRAYIDRVNFKSNVDWIPSTSVFTREGLGFTTRNVNAIEFEFDPEVLTEFITDHTSASQRVHDWLALKYLLYGEDMPQVRSRNGFSAFDSLVDNAGLSSGENDSSFEQKIRNLRFTDDDEQTEYAEVVFLHTFAHLIRDRLSVEYGASSEQLQYYIEHPNLSIHNDISGKVRVVIYEPAISGYGYLDRFKNQLKSPTGIELGEFIKNTKTWLEKHSRNIRETQKTLEEHLSEEEDELLSSLTSSDVDTESSKEITQQKLEELISSIEEYANSFDSTETFPHLRTLRTLVDNEHELSHETAQLRRVLNRLLKHMPHCWDGCTHCVSAGDDCSMLPFDEPFLVSRELGTEAISTIHGSLASPSVDEVSDQELLDIIDDHLDFSRDAILVMTPEIDQQYVNKLQSLAIEREVDITLVVEDRGDIDVPQSIHAVEIESAGETTIVFDGTILLTGNFVLDELEISLMDSVESTLSYAREDAVSALDGIKSLLDQSD